MKRSARLLERAVDKKTLRLAKRRASSLHEVAHIKAKLSTRRSPKHFRTFSLDPTYYGQRGGFPYFEPLGWVRFSLQSDETSLRKWPVAYHGTQIANAIRILAEGMQRPLSKHDVAHGQAGSETQKSMYVSPSVEYAAHPVCASFHQVGPARWIQTGERC